jgi:hypothetical protein
MLTSTWCRCFVLKGKSEPLGVIKIIYLHFSGHIANIQSSAAPLMQWPSFHHSHYTGRNREKNCTHENKRSRNVCRGGRDFERDCVLADTQRAPTTLTLSFISTTNRRFNTRTPLHELPINIFYSLPESVYPGGQHILSLSGLTSWHVHPSSQQNPAQQS